MRLHCGCWEKTVQNAMNHMNGTIIEFLAILRKMGKINVLFSVSTVCSLSLVSKFYTTKKNVFDISKSLKSLKSWEKCFWCLKILFRSVIKSRFSGFICFCTDVKVKSSQVSNAKNLEVLQMFCTKFIEKIVKDARYKCMHVWVNKVMADPLKFDRHGSITLKK